MYLLGVHLPDHKLVRIALQNFYGISDATAKRLCARLYLHDNAKVSHLTESQVTELSAYLSSPGSIPARKPTPTSPYPVTAQFRSSSSAPASSSASGSASSKPNDPMLLPPSQRPSPAMDPLRSIVIESDLKRQMQENVFHHKTVGSYKGRRHAGGFPVRGQRTQSNAQTARKLNRIERRQMSTTSIASACTAFARNGDVLGAGISGSVQVTSGRASSVILAAIPPSRFGAR
ncbi:S13-like H2TH domain-containing protein [Tilletiaria anomala UBC 951]|uniref:S13-like H2TH domain-containing protein n=1 Tax=Tilletiaria anomala (strain ATCC 24038 / CBS 436.72 / UBC 951) TaxID=1037660 RepID=A0A066V5P5_TILAU|nr:S13-like H2TH domain-containing protein [Tilletiaria anomala UBC 951]KDN36781.1 S13-like H2TH domain-containing protein [Tilletiaria anomala UBC 951]